ncbi:hypothetical protein QFZ28_004381 [Neobacillus niacini]|uniref:hypothetical protein n=1 Tax=Neobacillus niacini TaxID=86668 RepID=UPI00278731C3|nr:hypothetical protein [Neobacillus niacini]MDQ1003981.1 hypothetical protein [Neobacillus niacini]
MTQVVVEMIMDKTVRSQEKLDSNIVQLMMQSEYVTISGNTIKVAYKNVSSKGIVKFYGNKENLD